MPAAPLQNAVEISSSAKPIFVLLLALSWLVLASLSLVYCFSRQQLHPVANKVSAAPSSFENMSLAAVPSSRALPAIVIGILTGSGTQASRVNKLHPVLFGGQLPHQVLVLYVTDSLQGLSPHVMRATQKNNHTSILVLSECGDGQRMPMICKLMGMMRHLVGREQSLQWLLRVTDDTYVHVGSLIKLTQQLPSGYVCGGELYEWGGHRYLDGGAGWIMSASLIFEKILPQLETGFLRAIVQGRSMEADDVAFGHFLVDVLKVEPMQLQGFHNELLYFKDKDLHARKAHDFHAHIDGSVIKSEAVVACHLRMGYQAGSGTAANAESSSLALAGQLNAWNNEINPEATKK